MPIDPSYPIDRIDYILKDANACILLTQRKINITCEIEKLNLDELIFQPSYKTLEFQNKLSDLAYIIYTSGTTGKPKGVMIENKQLLNFCLWYKDEYKLSISDSVASYSNFCFDASISEIMPTLISGGCLHIIKDEIRLDIEKLNDYFLTHHITIASMPTKFGELYTSNTVNNCLRYLFLAGEKLTEYNKQRYQIVNGYGPTETTIYATTFKVDQPYHNIPIGKPVSNVFVYVVLENGQLAPFGVFGELWITGAQVGRGYKNLKILTENKFLQDPFNPHYRLYKTGDIVKMHLNGDLEFIGRNDEQVKIRGYRIELKEIESCLKSLTDVSQTVVIDYKTDSLDAQLYAFLTSKSHIKKDDIYNEITNILPHYMIPSDIFILDELPYLHNGKVNKQFLKEFIINQKNTNKPSETFTQTEKEIYNIWKNLIKNDNINKSDSFFQVGGHSLLAIRLNKRINDYFHTNIPVSFIYTEDTIEKQALLIKQKQLNLQQLVKIKTGDTKESPIFCIHDLLGEILSYRNIAYYLDNRDIYGIRYSYKVNEAISIERLAKDYLKLIKTIQPNGPYHLVGYSAGGTIVYEMAQQIMNNGEKVALLVLIDTPNYCVYPKYIKSFYRHLIKYGFRWFLRLTFKSKVEFIKYSLTTFLIDLISSLLTTEKYKVFPTQIKLRDALIEYQTKPYRSQLILIKTYRKIKNEMNLGWDEINDLKVYPLKGNHITVVNKKNAKIVAEYINGLLKEENDENNRIN